MPAINPFYESSHLAPRPNHRATIASIGFSHSLGPKDESTFSKSRPAFWQNRALLAEVAAARAQGRGLKPHIPESIRHIWESPLAQGRGLKRAHHARALPLCGVAPRAGARIETRRLSPAINFLRVAPRAGARIETKARSRGQSLPRVAPRAGARIETPMRPCVSAAPIRFWRTFRMVARLISMAVTLDQGDVGQPSGRGSDFQ